MSAAAAVAVLVVQACLAREPGHCERFELLVERCGMPITLYATASQWAVEHPAWTLRRVGPCMEGRAA